MAIYKNTPPIVTSGLVLNLDAANYKSYVSGSTNWFSVGTSNISSSLFNNPTFNIDGAGSVGFNGSTNYGLITASPTLAFSSNFSISVWVKVNAIHASGYNGIAGRFGPSSNYNGYIIECNNQFSGNKFAFTLGNANSFLRITADSTITFGRWYNVVGTNTANVNRLYIDTTLQTTTSTFTVATSATQDFAIGRYYAEQNNFYHNGNISNIMIYNKALSLAEIQQNYNTLKSRYNLS
jgi:hypothetical protein